MVPEKLVWPLRRDVQPLLVRQTSFGYDWQPQLRVLLWQFTNKAKHICVRCSLAAEHDLRMDFAGALRRITILAQQVSLLPLSTCSLPLSTLSSLSLKRNFLRGKHLPRGGLCHIYVSEHDYNYICTYKEMLALKKHEQPQKLRVFQHSCLCLISYFFFHSAKVVHKSSAEPAQGLRQSESRRNLDNLKYVASVQ